MKNLDAGLRLQNGDEDGDFFEPRIRSNDGDDTGRSLRPIDGVDDDNDGDDVGDDDRAVLLLLLLRSTAADATLSPRSLLSTPRSSRVFGRRNEGTDETCAGGTKIFDVFARLGTVRYVICAGGRRKARWWRML